MLSICLLISVPLIILISYKLGQSSVSEVHNCPFDCHKVLSEEDNPIYNSMALDYPQTFMFMKSTRGLDK